ncbi:DNA methyltransferase [Mycoplasma sp. CSL10166]|uniref:DNA methyltransferase n=1 Tax=Mycoplasma sp. CSL10166 TaxID=2813825 RepID=UPI0035BEA3B0
MEKLILTHTNKNDIIFDPFMGSGTTAIAFINTKRIYIVGEIDKTYFEKSVERIERHLEENKSKSFVLFGR